MTWKAPWERHFALTEERLLVVAEILRKTRNDAIEDYSVVRGDGPWGHGCQVFDRTRTQLTRASATYEWLDIMDPSLHFVFGVGGVPIRFFRGDPEKPNKNQLHRDWNEKQQQQEAFFFIDDEEEGWFWRLAVVLDADERVMEVVILETRDSGETRNHWSIPLDTGVRVLQRVADGPEPVRLEPAPVSVRRVEQDTEEDEGGSD